MDNSGGDDRGGGGGQGRGCGAPRTVTARTRTEERGYGYHRQGWSEILFVGVGGVSSLQKRRQKTPHNGRAPPRRGLENKTPNPILRHPYGGTPRKLLVPSDDVEGS